MTTLHRCGKYGYPTAAAAYKAARGVDRRHGPPQRAYRCRDCTSANGGRVVWHLTSDLRHDSDHHNPRRQRKDPPRWRWRPQETIADE